VKTDFRDAELSARDYRMLEFAEKLTRYPWLMVESDVNSLRQVGFSDPEILQIVLGCAHFNYLNRMADGIGIRFEYGTSIPEFKVPQGSKANPPSDQTKGIQQVNRESVSWIAPPKTPQPSEYPGQPRNLYLAMGENAEARDLAMEWRSYQLKTTPGLSARQRARIALYISGLNRCDYNASWFMRDLLQMGDDSSLLSELAHGDIPENLPHLDQSMFRQARRLTQEPWTNREEDIRNLRRAGLDDRAILQLTMLASYLSFENRVALGLGISLEQEVEGEIDAF
jgi:uncharacterized peroxidase-related enzyme